MRSLITFDLHPIDSDADISYCIEWLTDNKVPATFFVPTIMLNDRNKSRIIHELFNNGIKIGTHAHRHDKAEVDALIYGDPRSLSFLETSKKTYEDFLGCSPIAFKSPFWCPISDQAFGKLSELGYLVDCSSTPQRFPFFSSFPFRNTWIFSKRSVHRHSTGILMVPTSCFLVPLASPTFETFRTKFSLLFLKMLKFESTLRDNVILNVTFHASDLNPNSLCENRPSFNWKMLCLKKYGGFGFRTLIRETSSDKKTLTALAILDHLKKGALLDIQEIFDSQLL